MDFASALAPVLGSIVDNNGGKADPKSEWRTTNATPLGRSRPPGTAPYLHNNSVPTIYDLLLPAVQRPQKFWVGSRQYDTHKLGYKSDTQGTPSFSFDTTQPGNSNAGHTGKEYGTDLSDEQRKELLEYLKSL